MHFLDFLLFLLRLNFRLALLGQTEKLLLDTNEYLFAQSCVKILTHIIIDEPGDRDTEGWTEIGPETDHVVDVAEEHLGFQEHAEVVEGLECLSQRLAIDDLGELFSHV